MSDYYNDNEPFVCAWLRNLIAAGLIPPGDVDERSIVDVRADDLRGYRRCHFFAGIGGWSLALRLAGWADDRPVWTGSCPCQPFSNAGKQRGSDDERHLWPAWFRLIRECRPESIFGEQVAGAAGLAWLDHVCADLESTGYAAAAADLPACSVGAPHVRQRLWWIADTAIDGRERLQRCAAAQVPQDWPSKTLDAWHGTGNPFEQWQKLLAESDVRRMADGVSSAVDIRPRLRAYGNAIVPQVAAAFIAAVMECRPWQEPME